MEVSKPSLLRLRPWVKFLFGGRVVPPLTGGGLLRPFGKLQLVANLTQARKAPLSRTSVPGRKHRLRACGKPTDKASFGSAGCGRKKTVINLCLYKLWALIYLILNLAKHTFLLFNVFKVNRVRLKIRFQVSAWTTEHGSLMNRHGV